MLRFASALKYCPLIMAIAASYERGLAVGAHFFQNCHYVRRLHALAKLQIDLACFDPAVLADNEFRCHGQKEAGIALVLIEFDADTLVEPLDLVADPKNKAKRQRITKVNVAQHGEREFHLSLRSQRCIGHDPA